MRGHGGAALILTLMLLLLPGRVSPSVIHYSWRTHSALLPACLKHHPWWQAVRFLLLHDQPPACDDEQPRRRRRCRRRHHHRSLTASAPASVVACLHPRRHLPSAHVPPYPPPTYLPHTPIARPSPGSRSSSTSARAREELQQAHFVAHLPCRHHCRSSLSAPAKLVCTQL